MEDVTTKKTRKSRSVSGQLSTADAYIVFAQKLLAENPSYWSVYAKRVKHYFIFKQSDNGKVVEVMSYYRYKDIIATYFRGATKYIIDGDALVLGNNLGRIAGRRVERNFKNKQVNWEATRKMWEEKGEKKGLVYWLDDEWVRIGWTKTGKLKNRFLYEFKPAEGNSTGRGFKLEFSQANKENPLLKLRYEFFPYIREKEEDAID